MERRDFIRSVILAGASTMLGTAERADASPGSWPSRLVPGGGAKATRLDDGWRFLRADVPGGERPGLDDAAWERVSLPHTARIESLVTGPPGSGQEQWQGVCWYRLPIRVGEEAAGKKVFLHFEAAMNVAEVWIDGEEVGHHLGGWLPFTVDLTGRLVPGRESVLAVRLDNRDNPVTGPKPLSQLDFNLYHGLYRYVHLVAKDPLHITDPLLADLPASGGVFVTYPQVSRESATVRVQTHVRNDHLQRRTFRVRTTIIGPDGAVVARDVSPPVTLAWEEDAAVAQEIEIAQPRLWSPAAPHLHRVRTEIVVDEDTVVDAEETRVGIRRIDISADGFRINGERMFLRGTNRHQEHPYVGFAVPAAAQWRDAKRIKEAGFDYIRLSHYPHSPAFMDACDELGIVVMDCIPGWQFFGPDPEFAEVQYRNCRDLVRRDRNRPSVILWEVSLNETAMPPEFVARTHAIAHEEYPGDQCCTCGWTKGYDVFIQARQHGGCVTTVGEACVVSEYGDWEYYAMTAGLNQDAWEGLTPAESNSRQLRWHGERAMLQQAANFQEAHNDNRKTIAFADGLWVMFDYNRGYAPDVESSGCMDLFRLEKYSWHFFRSQRSPSETAGGAMVFVASAWTPASATDVRVFSNCDEVELRLDGTAVERRRPDRDRMSTHMAHPPFTFALGRFTPGTLEAVGYIAGREAARHAVRTPGPIAAMEMRLDLRGRAPDANGQDAIFCHAELRDAHGTLVSDAWENVAFGATGAVSLGGRNPFSTDAGVASIVAVTRGAAPGAVYALSIVRGESGARVLGASTRVAGDVSPFELRYTTDGSDPGPASPVYTTPIAGAGRVRAALFVAGQAVARLDEGAERFRVRGSAAPETRDPFRAH